MTISIARTPRPSASAALDAPSLVLERAKAGDSTAFRELFLQHRDGVARIVARVLGPGGADVEDVVQEVFLHVFRSLRGFRGDSKFTTWLYRLTVNVTKMHLRRRASRPRIADVPLPEASADAREDGPDLATDQALRVRALYRLLEQLSEKKRTVLVLHDFEGMSAQEIAAIVGAPVLTVRTRLFYARKELYSALAAEPALASVLETLKDELPGRPGAPTGSEREASGG